MACRLIDAGIIMWTKGGSFAGLKVALESLFPSYEWPLLTGQNGGVWDIPSQGLLQQRPAPLPECLEGRALVLVLEKTALSVPPSVACEQCAEVGMPVVWLKREKSRVMLWDSENKLLAKFELEGETRPRMLAGSLRLNRRCLHLTDLVPS